MWYILVVLTNNPGDHVFPSGLHLSLHVQPPSSGPESNETESRRFSSSHTNPQIYTRKRQQDARGCGEYTNIHDARAVDPADFDVLLTDITHIKFATDCS